MIAYTLKLAGGDWHNSCYETLAGCCVPVLIVGLLVIFETQSRKD